MPSLAQLKQFQNLMGTVGKEDEFRAKNGLPSDDYTLPDREPAPLPAAAAPPPPAPEPPPAPPQEPPKPVTPPPPSKPVTPPEPAAPKTPAPRPAASPPAPPKPVTPPEPAPPPELPGTPDLEAANDEGTGLDFDFGDFLNSKPDDTDALPPIDDDIPFDDEIPLETPPAAGESESPGLTDDFDFSDLVLDGAPDTEAPVTTVSPEAAPAGESAPPDDGAAGFDDSFFDSFGDDAVGEAPVTDTDPFAGLDMTGLSPDAAAGLEDDIDELKDKPYTTEDDEFLGNIKLDASDEEISSLFPDAPVAEEPSVTPRVTPSVTPMATPEAAPPDAPLDAPFADPAVEPVVTSLDSLDAAFDAAPVDAPADDTGGGDPFDSFDLGGEPPSPAENLPDIDDLNLNLPKEGEVPAIEEVSLTEEELKALINTLATYPLNVRIACEETIAEQVIPPAQLSELVKLLIAGSSAHDAAKLLSKILKKTITVPKGYKTGEELEEEQASFAYIFIHKFLPFARIAFVVALLAASVVYLSWQFIYKPLAADSLYKRGYELILSGEPNNYTIANQYFNDAFGIHRVKDWFYKYAERFRDERQYLHAEDKYEMLLRVYPHDKKGALDYAAMEAYYLRNYEKADRIVRREILDYSIDDRDGLLALGDVNLAWGEIDKARYEEAREAYARHLAIYGFSDPVLERMMLYFIRTDKLVDVLPLQRHFMGSPKSKIGASSLAELGGYLLDKRFEVPNGVPDENVEHIEGIKDILLRAAKLDGTLPEPHYHLARYYEFYGDPVNERVTLEAASRAFDNAKLETPTRVRYRVDTQRKLAGLMMEAREFIPAENALVKGVNIYEDAVSRRVLARAPEYGRLYADLGDIEYFAKTGDMARAGRYYLDSEANGWMPPEIEYRLGAAWYRQGAFHNALERFFNVSKDIPFNRKLLNTLGVVSFVNSDYFASEAYYKRLLTMLRRDRDRLPIVLPDNVPEHRVLLERMMIAENNMGVTMNALAGRAGKPSYRSEALGMFSESARIWDALERDQKTMVRPGLTDPALPGASLPYLNIRQTLYPVSGESAQMFARIDADVLDPSVWEERMSLAH
jgi:hypothetical protein